MKSGNFTVEQWRLASLSRDIERSEMKCSIRFNHVEHEVIQPSKKKLVKRGADLFAYYLWLYWELNNFRGWNFNKTGQFLELMKILLFFKRLLSKEKKVVLEPK